MRDHLEGAAERVAGFLGRVDLRDHPRFALRGRRSAAANRRESLRVVEVTAAGSAMPTPPMRDDVARDLDAEAREELAGEGAGGDARRGLAGAGALEDVAHVVALVLQRAGEVGVARAAAASPARARAPVASSGGSAPTCIVFCQLVQSRLRIEQRDRPAERLALADAREHLGRSDSIAMRRPRP